MADLLTRDEYHAPGRLSRAHPSERKEKLIQLVKLMKSDRYPVAPGSRSSSSIRPSASRQTSSGIGVVASRTFA